MNVLTTTNVSPRTRIVYFDRLRTVAIIAVIVLHTAASGWYRAPVSTAGWQLLNLIDSSVRFCVPVFFMISGALFLDPKRRVTFRTIFTKSLPRIAIPFAIWSLLFAAVTTFGPDGDHSWKQLAVRFVLGHYHLWFLIALAGLYLATPLLRLIVAERKHGWYFVLLAGVFTIMLPLFEEAPRIGWVLTEFLGTMKFSLVLGYSVYFVLGYLLSTTAITRRRVALASAAGAVGLICTALGTSLLSLRAGSGNALLFDYLTPNVLLMSIAVFVFVRYQFEKRDELYEPGKVETLVSQYSFGIYLIHPAFQALYEHLGFTAEITSPLISVPVLAASILVPSLLTAIALRRLPGVGPYIA